MKLRSLGIAGLLSALGLTAVGCGDDPTVKGTTGSSSSSSSSGDVGGSAGAGGAAGSGGMAMGGAGGAGGTAGGGGMATGGAGGMGGGMMMPAEYCANGVDDDMDGATDCMDTKCAGSAVCGKLIINEVDYDQVGADTAEYVELYNAGTTDITLDGLDLVLINGNGGMSVVYGTEPLTGTLMPGQYMAIAQPGVMSIDPGAITQTLNTAVQNGGTPMAPSGDAILIHDPVNSVAIDAICYECVPTAMPPVNINGVDYPLVAGMPSAVEDAGLTSTPNRAIIRYPNAADTGDDSVDWIATTVLTPGAANQIAAEVCLDGMALDEDADGLVDCDDPDCAMEPACIPPEICDNGMDEDGDMLTDCADPDCDTQTCGMNGLTCSMGMCACPGGAMEMTCNDMMDNDCDGVSDCNDPDCTGTPSCSTEICDNGLDEDGDMLTDCADPDCAMQACGMNGLTCDAMNMCSCPGGMMTEAMCTDMLDEDCDGMVDCADPDCALDPACFSLEVTSVDYPVIAQGGTLVVTGKGFTGATAVTIGGTNEMFTLDSDTQITITPVDDATPLAMQDLVITTPNGMTMPYGVTVIRLQINELDCDTTPNPDAAEFIEVSTGVPNVDLAGYTLVFWNGNGDISYRTVHLNSTADANGLLFVGNPGTMPPSMITWPNDNLQNGADAVAIHQALPAAYPTNTSIAAATRIIDALVYGTADGDDAGLLDAFLGTGMDPKRVQVDETTMHPVSIQRCADGRRDGRRFVTGAPTMGMMNNVAACP